MTRLALGILLLSLPLAAAPVPKSLQRQSAPQVLGTTWEGKNIGGGVAGTYRYTFGEDGKFTTTKDGQPYTSGTWTQDADMLEWEFNRRFAVYTVKYKDGIFEGTASNVKGNSWNVVLKPIK